jgi:hypothetical protein
MLNLKKQNTEKEETNMTRILFFSLLLAACSAKVPQVIYQDRIITHTDTVNYVSVINDSIPCDDFKREISEGKDTVYIEVVKNKISVKTVVKRDTVVRTEVVTIPKKVVNKIDNSVTAKRGSVIGDGNTMTTKKTNWWWIFLAGMLTWFIIQNVLWKTLKVYIKPF